MRRSRPSRVPHGIDVHLPQISPQKPTQLLESLDLRHPCHDPFVHTAHTAVALSGKCQAKAASLEGRAAPATEPRRGSWLAARALRLSRRKPVSSGCRRVSQSRHSQQQVREGCAPIRYFYPKTCVHPRLSLDWLSPNTHLHTFVRMYPMRVSVRKTHTQSLLASVAVHHACRAAAFNKRFQAPLALSVVFEKNNSSQSLRSITAEGPGLRARRTPSVPGCFGTRIPGHPSATSRSRAYLRDGSPFQSSRMAGEDGDV